MDNMANCIKHHRNRIVARLIEFTYSKLCNCRIKEKCPLIRKYLLESLVYEAKEESSGKIMNYYGVTEGHFKSRYRSHTKYSTTQFTDLELNFPNKFGCLKNNKNALA